MNLYEMVEVPKQALNIFGHWPERPLTRAQRVRRYLSNTFLFSFCSILIIEALHVSKTPECLEKLSYLSPPASTGLKLITFKLQEKKFLELLDFLNDTILRNVYATNFEKTLKFTRRVGLGYQLNCAIVVAMVSWTPVIDDRDLPIPFNVFNAPSCKYSLYCFQVLALFNAAGINTTLDCLLTSFLNLIDMELKVLNKKITNYAISAKAEIGETQEKKEMRFLGKCVDHHNQIIRLTALVEAVFSSNVLIEYFTSIATICTIGFQLVTAKPLSLTFFITLFYLLAMMSELAMYCWFSNEIIVQSSATRDACYESDWFNSTPKVRKMLILIMERSKRPLHLTSGKFFVVSLSSFCSVINSAFSFFAVIRKKYV